MQSRFRGRDEAAFDPVLATSLMVLRNFGGDEVLTGRFPRCLPAAAFIPPPMRMVE